jgi:uncharacterized tellurite resistance protein B-like protein
LRHERFSHVSIMERASIRLLHASPCDRRVTELEDNLLWRAADLLGVSSRERIELRQRVTGRDSGDP